MKKPNPDIVDRLLIHTHEHPEATAFIILGDDDHAERKVSYYELGSLVISLAAWLSKKHFTGTRVLLIYQNTLAFIVAFLACQYAGKIPCACSLHQE